MVAEPCNAQVLGEDVAEQGVEESCVAAPVHFGKEGDAKGGGEVAANRETVKAVGSPLPKIRFCDFSYDWPHKAFLKATSDKCMHLRCCENLNYTSVLDLTVSIESSELFFARSIMLASVT